MKATPPRHPLLGVDLSVWRVTQFIATVEMRNVSDGRLAVIPKPYDPKPKSWWRKQAAEACRKAA